LGGFDESLTDAEDFELGERALEQGYDVYFDRSNIAWHDDYITCRSYIKRRREYERAAYTVRNEQKPPNVTKMAYSTFAHRLWVRLIDHGILKRMLPISIRYRLYSVVIWGLSRHFPSRRI
jgi:GT2 family glycosyltransferase